MEQEAKWLFIPHDIIAGPLAVMPLKGKHARKVKKTRKCPKGFILSIEGIEEEIRTISSFLSN